MGRVGLNAKWVSGFMIWLIIGHWAVSVMKIIHCVCFFCIAEAFYLFLSRREEEEEDEGERDLDRD